ncbi:MAG: RidA family protein [Pseudomonadota bacterium]
MNREISTDKAPPSFSNYAQAMEVPPGARCVHVSGQVGVTPDGRLPEASSEQHELAWQNIFAILESADMEKSDIVEVWAIVRDHGEVPVYREIRDRMLEGHRCVSTMLVCSLASPDWKVEIAVRACKVD